MEDTLRKVRLNDIPLFSLKGHLTNAKLVGIYDGDTGDIVLEYNGTLLHVKARFLGYDTCEMKPPLNDPDRENKKKRAVLAKKRLWELCTGCSSFDQDHQTLIKIRCGEFDKYGRTLITAFPYEMDVSTMTDEEAFLKSFNYQMIQEGHAYAYDGGKKQSF